MPSPAFAAPVAALAPPAAAAAAAAGVCERLAQHDAQVAQRSAAARIAWEAELASLRTTASAAVRVSSPPPTATARPQPPLTGAAAVLAARVARIVGEPAVLVREAVPGKKKVAGLDEAEMLARYHARMASHGWQLAGMKKVDVDREGRGEKQTQAIVKVKGGLSSIVRVGTKPVKAVGNTDQRKEHVSKAAPAVARWASAATPRPAPARSASVAQTAQPVAPVAAETVQRPNLVEAVMRAVKKWVDAARQQGTTDEKPDDAVPAAAPSAAVGAAQVLAVLFSMGSMGRQ